MSLIFEKKYGLMFILLVLVGGLTFVIAQSSDEDSEDENTLPLWNPSEHIVWHDAKDIKVSLGGRDYSLQTILENLRHFYNIPEGGNGGPPGTTRIFTFTIPNATGGNSEESNLNSISSLENIIYEGGVDTGTGLETTSSSCKQNYTELKEPINTGATTLESGKPYVFTCVKGQQGTASSSVIILDENFKTIYTDNSLYKRIEKKNLLKTIYFEDKKDKFEYQVALENNELKVRVKEVGERCTTENRNTQFYKCTRLNRYGIEETPSDSYVTTSPTCQAGYSSIRITERVTTCQSSRLCPINKYQKMTGLLNMDTVYQAQWKEITCQINSF
ncbi:MAG: hypothetical protein QW727_01660 [Candidatus Pacearchaeota archaeon]